MYDFTKFLNRSLFAPFYLLSANLLESPRNSRHHPLWETLTKTLKPKLKWLIIKQSLTKKLYFLFKFTLNIFPPQE